MSFSPFQFIGFEVRGVEDCDITELLHEHYFRFY